MNGRGDARLGAEDPRGASPGALRDAGLEYISRVLAGDLGRKRKAEAVAEGTGGERPAPDPVGGGERREAALQESISSLGASSSDGGSHPQGVRDGQPPLDNATARRERNRLQQKKFREKRKQRAEDLEGVVGELRDKAVTVLAVTVVCDYSDILKAMEVIVNAVQNAAADNVYF
eukprot:evm.model.scf_3.5 EVM.evm.TU.scf_3.5   scf_3:89317-90971(+)